MKIRKKIKMPVPRYVNEILEQDCNHFGLTREKLCNEIILKVGYKPLAPYHKLMVFEDKIEIQFNLQKECESYYDDICKEYGSTTDAELVRTILSTYINLSPFVREKLIRDRKVMFLMDLLKGKHLVKIDMGEEILESQIKSIQRCPISNYLKVSHTHGEEYLSKLKIIRK